MQEITPNNVIYTNIFIP